MTEKFNVPNLFYFPYDGGRITHIGRTSIAGCTTECGLPLNRGQPWQRRGPERGLCRECVRLIHDMVYRPGLRA